MCGIFGVVGEREAAPLLIQGLKGLEYRGYDSAGIATLSDGQFRIQKVQGRVSRLEEILKAKPLQGSCGIGHTRWATHGKPSDVNAHPHTDSAMRFAVVHNGIIENHASVRTELEGQGVPFRSETDTECIGHLLARSWRGNLVACIRGAASMLEGAYALAILCRDVPDTIAVTRHGSPLFVGVGDGQTVLSSDLPTLARHASSAYQVPEDGVMLMTKNGVTAYDADGVLLPLVEQPLEPFSNATGLGDYAHFMQKEMHEQPFVLDRLLSTYKTDDDFYLSKERVCSLRRIILVGCGSAYHAACLAALFMEELARIPATAEMASEFRYRNPVLEENTLVILISQSGETADTLAALSLAKTQAQTLAIVNAAGSSMSQQGTPVLWTLAGPEIAVATTKGYLTQAMLLLQLACFMAKARGTACEDVLSSLANLPFQAEQVLKEKIKHAYFDRTRIFFIGRGTGAAVAMEGSLKLKEISYLHAEAYPAGELKHGTIALVDPGTLVIALALDPAIFTKVMANVREVKARGADVLVLTTESLATEARKEADAVWTIPNTHPLCAAILAILPLQQFAYEMALARGCDIDKPRNLAKSVTVE